MLRFKNADYWFSTLWVTQEYFSIIITIIITAVVYFFIIDENDLGGAVSRQTYLFPHFFSYAK